MKKHCEFEFVRGLHRMKKKLILTIAFVVSLLPMLLNQYGGCRGVQEISGVINLLHPIGIVSVGLFLLGVWLSFQNTSVNKVLSLLGLIGIVVSELYQFLTWHVLTITGEVSLKNSFQLAFPEFYVGLAVSFLMIAVYFVIDKFVRTESSAA